MRSQQGYLKFYYEQLFKINKHKIIIMKNLIIVLIITGLTTIGFAQEKAVELEEVEVLGVNYKYLNDVGDSEVAKPVKILEKKVANFDLKNADFYEDETQDYDVYFNIPKGSILAVYDGEGEILRTSEKFKDISLPLPVANAVLDKYPGWRISGDIYLVTYGRNKGAKKMYKLFLEKDGNRKRIKSDENGKFI